MRNSCCTVETQTGFNFPVANEELTFWSVTGQRMATYTLAAGGYFGSGTSTTATVTNGSNVITVASTAGISVGENIQGPGIPANATVTSIEDFNVTMSVAATAAGFGVSVAFVSPPQLVATQTGTWYYFGSKLIKNAGRYVGADRLGSIGKYYPYGQEKPSATTNGTEKFTRYLRDSETGMDYALNRYHVPGTGRFLTPDPYMANGDGSADPEDPGSWNRYAYTRGGPISHFDPEGLQDCTPNPDGSYNCGGTTGYGTGYGEGGDPGGEGYGGGDAQVQHLTPALVVFMTQGQSTGSGTPPQPLPKIISANPTAAQATALNQGFQNALSKVGSLNCAQLFEPTAGAETAVGMASNTLTSANYYIMQNLGVTALTSTDNTVFLNAQGLFFNVPAAANGSVSVTIPGTRGRQQSITFASAQAFQAFILLHELGHETGVFGSDRNNPALNGAFSRDVLNDCFTKNSKGQYQ